MAVSAAPSDMSSATTDNGQLLAADGVPLSTKLARATRRSRIQAFLLVLPLLAFVTIFFVTPIVKMAMLSFSDDVFVTEMPRTTKALASWDGQGIPDEPVFKALVEDLVEGRKNRTTAKVGGQLNFIYSGARSLVVSTGRRASRFKAPFKEAVINKDKRWEDPVLWQLIRTVSTPTTSIYYLNAVDRTVDAQGNIVQVDENIRIHLQIFWRTLWLSAFVTFLCFLLGYPVSYLLAHLPTKTSKLAADMCAAAVLDFPTCADHSVDCAAAERWRHPIDVGEPGACRGPRSAAAGLQYVRHGRCDGARLDAADDPADLLGDEDNIAVLHAGSSIAWCNQGDCIPTRPTFRKHCQA